MIMMQFSSSMVCATSARSKCIVDWALSVRLVMKRKHKMIAHPEDQHIDNSSCENSTTSLARLVTLLDDYIAN
jgi:hypothetical protein